MLPANACWSDSKHMQCKLTNPPQGVQPVMLNVPEGSATAAALGWDTAAALSELGAQAGGQAGGQLYERRVSSIHTPDSSSPDICQQTQSRSNTWSRVQLPRPVTAVAAGEHHRLIIIDLTPAINACHTSPGKAACLPSACSCIGQSIMGITLHWCICCDLARSKTCTLLCQVLTSLHVFTTACVDGWACTAELYHA